MATIPSRKATFTEEEKRKLVEGTDAQGNPLSEAEKMKLSKMHTARTLGADWRERAAERSKAEESARAQQALAERAAANRRMQGLPTQKATKPKAKQETQDETPTITVKKTGRPKLWRVMMQGGDSSQDTFYDNEDDARRALAAMGGKGAVAGVRFPAKSREEESALKEQYMQRAAIGGKVAMTPKTGETEEDRIKRKISEVNPQATEEQKARYLQTLSQSRARGRERGGYAEEYQAAVAKGKAPTPYEERVMAEEARDRRMADFITRSLARDAAREKERSFQSEYNYLKSIERSARRSGQFGVALDAKRQLEDLSGSLGSNARSVTARRKLFETEAMESAKRNIEARDRLRKEKLYKSTTSNPEASSPSKIYI